MINILEILDQYFFVWDRARHEAAIDGLELVGDIEREDSAEKRERLHQRIVSVVGFRQAEKLKAAKPEEVREALQAVRERQQYLKGYLEERFEAARQRAAARYPDPEVFGEQEVRRDAAFYTLARSGLMVISDALIGGSDWEIISGEISNGQRLDSYLPSEIIDLTRHLLPRAILFNEQRDELKSVLRSYGLGDDQLRQIDSVLPDAVNLDLPEEQRQQVNNLLERCVRTEVDFEREFSGLAEQLDLGQPESQELKQKLKKVVKGSAFRLARGLDGLRSGRVDEGVLCSPYREKSSYKRYPLSEQISKIGLRESRVDHTHTTNARYNVLLLQFLSVEKGLSTKLLKYLEIDDISCWHTFRTTFLDPVTEPDPETLGCYVGHLLFGNGFISESSIGYSPKNKGREWFLNLLEEAGKLKGDLSIVSSTSGELAERMGVHTKTPDRVLTVYRCPTQISNLAKYALQNCSDQEFYRSTLRSWLSDRYAPRIQRNGGRALIKREYEGQMRQMASTIGLDVSEGVIERGARSKRVSIRNPEVVGYRPAANTA